MKNNDNELLVESYVLKRLVYVNSANHGYSEIMLDKHMALFGDNNAGKTASLAGTKLLLYPEVNFHKCEKKFKFEGKRGLFSKEESYDFYFPDAKSFIALEVTNPEGTFCMILYRMNSYAYGRFFIPLPYENIRNIFWNAPAEAFSDDLSIQTISKFVKSNHGIQVTNSKEISDLIFSSYRSEKLRKRFCVLPLKDDRPASISAFKNIYQLAFETGNAETEALPEAIAALLEMGRSRDEERLDANLTQLSEEHSQLVKKEEWFQVLSNNQMLFKQVNSEYESLVKELKTYSKRFHSIKNTMIKSKTEYLPSYKDKKEKTLKVESEKNKLNDEITKLNSLLIEEKVIIEEWKKVLVLKKNEEREAKQFIATFNDKQIRTILVVLNNNREKLESNLGEYTKENGTKTLLERNIKKRNDLIKEKGHLANLIKNSESSVLHQLHDTESASVLLSLNKSFASVSTIIDDDHKAVIKKFTNLFDKDGADYLTFLDKTVIETPFKYFDEEEQLGIWESQKLKVIKQLKTLDKEISTQSKALKNKNIARLIESTKQELEDVSHKITMVNGLDGITKSIRQKETELNERESRYTSNLIKINELKTQMSKLKGKYNILIAEVELLKEQEQTFKQIDEYLSNATMLCSPIDCKIEETSDLTITKAQEVFASASAYTKKYNEINNQIRRLLSDCSHPDIDTHKELKDLGDCSKVVQIYNSSFSTLEYDLNQHRNEVSSHNQWVSNQLNELKEAKSLLLNFISTINQELNSNQISNLSEIRLHLEMHKRFESLLSTLEKHDIQDDSLLDPQFYISLSKFVDEYFNKKTRRLKMHDIIRSINYQYTLKDTSEVVTKSQSGGTTSTITAFVLSVLLRRITPKYVSLRMPIVVDEMSTLDFKNAAATIMQISDHGFSIFCATPSYSSYISMKVGRWIMIDRAMVKKPLVNYCHMNILPEHVESFGEKASEA